VEERVKQFIPATCAKGKLGQSASRTAAWFDCKKAATEIIHSLSYPPTPLRCMAIVVSDTPQKTNIFFTAFPYAVAGGLRRLKLVEIRDAGNQVEGELIGVTLKSNALVGFFDTHFFANQDQYKVDETYDFQLAGLIYEAECTNDKIIEVTDQKVLAERYAALGESPERLPDGSLPPYVFHYANTTGLGPSDQYPDDAEFYCVIEEVTEFDLDGIRVFQITPKLEDENLDEVPLPRVIFGVAGAFKDGYVPKAGDSIGGMLWVQGFLEKPVGAFRSP